MPVAESFARYARSLEPRTLRQIRLALRAFEWLPFPWRFSRSSLEARQRFLADLELSRLSIHRDLLLLIKVMSGVHYARDERVRIAVGYEERCAVAADTRASTARRRSPPRWETSPPEEGEECDVAVVGSGAGARSPRRSSPRPGSTSWCSKPAGT